MDSRSATGDTGLIVVGRMMDSASKTITYHHSYIKVSSAGSPTVSWSIYDSNGKNEYQHKASDLGKASGSSRYLWSCNIDLDGTKVLATFSQLLVSGDLARSTGDLKI